MSQSRLGLSKVWVDLSLGLQGLVYIAAMEACKSNLKTVALSVLVFIGGESFAHRQTHTCMHITHTKVSASVHLADIIITFHRLVVRPRGLICTKYLLFNNVVTFEHYF